MRTLTVLRGAGLALTLLTGSALGGCSTFPEMEADVTVTSATEASKPTAPPLGEIKDDFGLGQMNFARQNYGLSELHFRRAVEAQPGDAAAWLGLAASYDQLKRWTLADRAYAKAFKITGATPEFLNNRGYSYLLRGDVRRASADLSLAAARDPDNEHIQNNLKTLDEKVRGRG
jgi:Flp pilus assembly protein TadD